MKGSIDRIENGFAIVQFDEEQFSSVPLSILPKGIKEGSIIEKNENGEFVFLEEETIALRKINIQLQNSLFE